MERETSQRKAFVLCFFSEQSLGLSDGGVGMTNWFHTTLPWDRREQGKEIKNFTDARLCRQPCYDTLSAGNIFIISFFLFLMVVKVE